MSWTRRLARIFLDNAVSRSKRSKAPRSRRVAVEPLEERRLLSVGGTFDFGDLPDNYGTTLAADGARHEATGPTLGATRDAEADGLPTVGADGDGADDDGVTFGSIRVGQLDASVTVNVQNAPSGAKLDAWIDFNGDGSFGGAGERIAASVEVSEGDNVIEFDVPSWAASGEAYARFRVSTAGDLGPRGESADGEVEDYRVAIEPPVGSPFAFAEKRLILPDVDTFYLSVVTADFNGDGLMDVAIHGMMGDDTFMWYENDATGQFTPHSIAMRSSVDYDVLRAVDVNGDGHVDLLGRFLAHDKYLEWFENDGQGNFTARDLGLDGAVNSISAADINGDGNTDFIAVDYSSLIWYENDGSKDFTAHTIGAVSGLVYSVLAADINGDGHMDVVMQPDYSDPVVWYENDGSAGFVERPVGTAAGHVNRLAVADLNGDNHLDIVSLCGQSVAWYENDGSGAFAEPATIGNSIADIAVADVNGDGHMDVVGGSVWFENDGHGNFLLHAVASGEAPRNVACADMNGDGRLDLIAALSEELYWHESYNPNRDFGDAPDSYGTTWAANGARHDMAGPKLGVLRDLDAEGQPTVAADGDDADGNDDEDGVTFGSTITVGQVDASVTVNVQEAPSGAMLDAWIDFDGDGTFDSNEQIADCLYVSEGSNLVTFSVPFAAPPGETYARFRLSSQGGLAPVGMAVDGEVEDYRVTILSPGAILDFGDAPGNYGTTFAENGARHGATGPTLGATRDAELNGSPTVDADGDGGDDEDGVTFGSIRVGQLGATATVNVQSAPGGARLDAWIDFNGDGSFGGADERIADSLEVSEGDNSVAFDVPSWSVGGETYARFRLSSSGDLATTGGAEDGEVEDYRITIASPVAAGFLVPREPVALSASAADIIPTDMDGDGDMDVLVLSDHMSIVWYENDGTESYAPHTIDTNVETLAAADMDGDGDTDFLSLSASNYEIHWYENGGGGEFVAHKISKSYTLSSSMFIADLDRDGDMDFVSASKRKNQIDWYENDGDEEFVVHTITSSADDVQSVFAADVDGDGDVDVLSASAGDSTIAWYENNGEGNFAAHAITTSAMSARSVFAADVDGDGDMDVLSASASDKRIAWYENDGNESFATHTITSTADGASSVFAADLDGDGDVDVLSSSQGDDKVAWYENDGSESFTTQTITSSASYAPVLAADMDDDGDLDVLFSSTSDGKVAWYENLAPIDYGDAPDSYGTTMAENGARHTASGPTLGTERDVDGDGLPTAAANGDDQDGSDDEDGVTFAASLYAGQIGATVNVNVQNAPTGAKLDAWIDFDGDGAFDENERIANSLEVANGDNSVTFDVPASAVAGTTYARFRLSSAGNLAPTGDADDGEVEDYTIRILAGPTDFGDAPDSYGTSLAADGAGHEVVGPRLGASRDAEIDGQPTTGANGDNENGDPDEDGVTFGSPIAAGQTGAVTVNVQNAPTGAKLDAWIDFDGDGTFEANEQIAAALNLSAGDNPVNFDVPLTATIGETYSRFRLSSSGNLAPTGLAEDGEVEDHQVSMSAPPRDLGDAPNGYQTTLAVNGPWHVNTGPTLGSIRDAEPDGLPSADAKGDDKDGSADEDGVTFEPLVDGQLYTTVTVNVQNAPSGAKLDAWIDFNRNGYWADNEQIADNLAVSEGNNLITFDVPSWAVLGDTYARFRLSSVGDLMPTGPAADGEVEDYAVTIVGPTSDYGDAPDSYGTTRSTDGARHLAAGPTLGQARDVETDGFPTSGADGDDGNATDDEDGLSFPSTLIVDQKDGAVTVNVQNAPDGAKLDAWIDFDQNGSFDPGEQIFDSAHVTEGDNIVLFEVPESAVAGETYARFRLSSAGDLDPTGEAADGEVEDYTVTIYAASLNVPHVDLGAVNFVELRDVDLTKGDQAYYFTTTNRGYLTIDGRFDSDAGSVTLRLLDPLGNTLSEVTSSGNYLRIDRLEPTGSSAYALQVTGTNPDVDLRICNLVELAGRAVTVRGTDSADQFEYVASETHDVTINGVPYHFDRTEVDSVSFDGEDGVDEAVLTGSAGDESATFYPGHGSMTTTTTGFAVSVQEASHITVNSGGGIDTVQLVDSTGDDVLVATPTQMTMSGTPVDGDPYTLTGNNFRYAHGYAKAGGHDTAQLTGSENTERVKPYENFVKLIGSGYFNRTKFFDTTVVDVLGGTDNGVMVASNTRDAVWAMKNDIRIARNANVPEGETPDYDNLTYDVTIAGCEYFVARASGNDDWVEFHDSTGDDVLIAKPHKIQIMDGPDPDANTQRGSVYKITARGFYHMTAIADQGGDNDSAKIYDSAEEGVDVWAAAYVDGETWSSMTSPSRLLYEVLAFEHVGGYGFNGGLGEEHGTNRKDHADDVDFVFQYGYWEE